jgi:hypothetical protein
MTIDPLELRPAVRRALATARSIFVGRAGSHRPAPTTRRIPDHIIEAVMASPKLSRQLLGDIVAANRILSAQGVLDTWGHVSVRDPADPRRYWMSRSMAPALVAASDIMAFDLDSKPVGRQSRKVYIERFIHGEIYKARADVAAVLHNHAPALIPFTVTDVPLRPPMSRMIPPVRGSFGRAKRWGDDALPGPNPPARQLASGRNGRPARRHQFSQARLMP